MLLCVVLHSSCIPRGTHSSLTTASSQKSVDCYFYSVLGRLIWSLFLRLWIGNLLMISVNFFTLLFTAKNSWSSSKPSKGRSVLKFYFHAKDASYLCMRAPCPFLKPLQANWLAGAWNTRALPSTAPALGLAFGVSKECRPMYRSGTSCCCISHLLTS